MKFVILLILFNIVAMIAFNINRPSKAINRANASNDQNQFLPKLMKIN